MSPSYDENKLQLLTHESEWELIKDLGDYSKVVVKAAEDLDPSQIAVYLYELSKAFSSFYRDCPIMKVAEENMKLAQARLALAECTLTVIKSAMELVLVPFLEKM